MDDLEYFLRMGLRNPKQLMGKIGGIYRNARFYATLEETFLVRPYQWLYERIKPNTTFIDLGASIGDTAIFFAANEKVRRIIAYEAMPLTYRIARRNLALSPLKKKITLVNSIVSSGSGTRYLKNQRGYGNAQLGEFDKGSKRVKVTNLNALLKGLKNVAIKCDVEGHELEIFKEARLDNVYAIELEYHDSLPQMARLLKARGF